MLYYQANVIRQTSAILAQWTVPTVFSLVRGRPIMAGAHDIVET